MLSFLFVVFCCFFLNNLLQPPRGPKAAILAFASILIYHRGVLRVVLKITLPKRHLKPILLKEVGELFLSPKTNPILVIYIEMFV